MDEKSTPMTITTLVGDECEQLYQLGLNDRGRHESLFTQVNHFLSTPYPLVERIASQLADYLVKSNLENNPQFKKRIHAYAEGLDVPLKDAAYATLIPELVSCLSKWLPGLPGGLMGCSSFFILDEKTQTPIHARVLDFPLQDSFDKNERCLLSAFSDTQKVFSIGSVGLPFHSVTGMNEGGVTLGLHQKFTNIFNMSGTSIFDIAHELLLKVETPQEAIKFLKSKKSITTWCFMMSFASHNCVVEADLMGDKLNSQTLELKPGEVLYFNNQLMNSKIAKESFIPSGLSEYNDFRSKNAMVKIEAFKKKKKFNSIELLKMISTPLSLKKSDSKSVEAHLEFDTLTPSSVSLACMNPAQKTLTTLSTSAPKVFAGEITIIKDCFNKPRTEVKIHKKDLPDSYFAPGFRHYARAQQSIDSHDLHQAYHHLQMGIAIFEKTHWSSYGEFFLHVLQFAHEPHPKLQAYSLGEFRRLREETRGYLKDQCTLFANRLERILGKPSQYQARDITNPELKKLFRLEQKIPVPLLHKSVCLFLAPRLDIRDVITAMLRPSGS
jgi:hypothetical protein